MMNDSIYQRIYDEISGILEDEGEKLVIYLEYGKASYTFSFYVKVNDQYINCYDIKNLSEDVILKAFSKIDSFVEIERKSNNTWSNMTMIVDSLTGKFHIDFDYTDLSEGAFKYKKMWKAKYLV